MRSDELGLPGEDALSCNLADVRDLYRDEFDSQVRRAGLILGDVGAAQDIVQSVFMKVSERWEQIESPSHYLSRAVLNGCRNEVRRRSRFRLVSRLPDRACSQVESDLADVLLTLPWNERAAVVLRYYADLSYKEIAGTLDCSEGSVGPWINRGLARLKEELDDSR